MTTISADPVFIDTNVLIYASISTSPYYSIAIDHLRYFENVRADQWISRQILREYLAVQTRPIPSKNMLSVKEITADIFSFQSRFLIAEHGPLVTDQLLKLIGSIPIGGKQIHDANLVATMLAHGLRRLLTHNVIDFQRFAGTIDVIPDDLKRPGSCIQRVLSQTLCQDPRNSRKHDLMYLRVRLHRVLRIRL